MQLRPALLLALCALLPATSLAGKPAPRPASKDAPEPAFLRDEQNWRAWMKSQIAEAEKPRREPPDPDPFAFSAFRGVRPEPMGDQTIINDAKMKIASLVVDEPPQVVEEEYLRVYKALNIPAFRGEVPNTRGVRYIAFRPEGSNNLKTITLVPRGRGTVVLASVGDPSRMLVRRGDLPKDVPLPPNAAAATSIAQTEGGAKSHTSSYVVRGATVQEVRRFYRDELAGRGFERRDGPGEVDEYERGTLLLSVTAQPMNEPGAVTLSVVWIE